MVHVGQEDKTVQSVNTYFTGDLIMIGNFGFHPLSEKIQTSEEAETRNTNPETISLENNPDCHG